MRVDGGPDHCSLSTRRQWASSASRIAETKSPFSTWNSRGSWRRTKSCASAQRTGAASSQSGQCTSVPPRSKITASGFTRALNGSDKRQVGSSRRLPEGGILKIVAMGNQTVLDLEDHERRDVQLSKQRMSQ